jgi:tetratricopeptide (TPR) repeat protein
MKYSFLSTFVLVFGAIAALFTIDMFLAKVERSETAAQAARLYTEGQQLAAAGRYNDAIAGLREALAISRDNAAYQLALANALLSAGKLDDAVSLLRDLLERDATNGEANLLMARALARQQRIAEAESYYHMAIYGRWPQDADANRTGARFELIDLLVKVDAKQQLLAELLPLQDQALTDPPTRARIARLFLLAGSPTRAADIFRQILRHEHQDADANAGLGEAEFARGNYRTAERILVAALRLRPGDAQLRKDLELCDDVVGLDPTPRGLSPAARFTRSRKILELTIGAVKQCTPSPTLEALTNQATEALKRRIPASRQADAAETDLNLAEKLWQAQKTSCVEPSQTSNEVLSLVMEKVSQ